MTNNWKRVGHVVNVLFKHGLSYFVHELGLKWHLPFFKKIIPRGRPPTDLPVRLRKVMEELGGAYLKLGQFLALRPDLLPPAYCDEFKKLLDEVPPVPFQKIENVIAANLKAPIRAFFQHIDPKPIGSASIAQVYRAKLKNGKDVAIKVQRPEAKEQFAADIFILYYIARKIEKRFSDRVISPLTIVKEFERYTSQELNFVLEARTIDRFAKHFAKSKTVVIPKVYWDTTTTQLITMDYLEGTKLTDILKQPENDQRVLLAKHVADAAFEQTFGLGVFHADLHPGNIMVMSNNRIGLLDFGIVGCLNEDLIKQAVAIYSGLVNKDTALVTKILLKAGVPQPDAEIEDLKREVERIVNEWYGTELGQTRVTEMMKELFTTTVNHGVALPVSFILLGKAMVTVEGTCLALDPHFNFVEYSQPKIIQLLKKQSQPKAVLKRFAKMSQQYAELIAELPQQTTEIIDKLKRGSIDLTLKETDVKHLGMDVNRSSNRLSYSLIIASLLITGALLVDIPPKIGAYSVFTVVSIMFASFLLLILLASIWREGHEPFDLHFDGKTTRR